MDNNRPLFDRRTLVALLFAFGVMQAWFWFTGINQPQANVDSDTPEVVVAPPPVRPAPPPVPDVPARSIPFRICNTTATVSTDGGSLRSVELLDYKADYRITPIWTWIIHQVTGPRGAWKPYDTEVGPVEMVTPKGEFFAIGSGDIGGKVAKLEATAEATERIELRGVTHDGLEVTRTFAGQSDCTIDVTTTWSNPASSPSYTGVAWLAFHDDLAGEVSSVGRSAPRPVAVLDKRQAWDIVEGPPVEVGGPVRVVGFADHYFAAVAASTDAPDGRLFTNERKAGDLVLHGVTVAWPQSIEPGKTLERHQRLYIGAQTWEPMNAVNPDLYVVVDQGWFGWFAFFGTPLLWVLRKFHGLTESWGVSIILLTLMFKTLFYPLGARAYQSSLKMQAIQPKIAALKEEFKDNPEELNRRTMALFSQFGVNPVGGCLPMFAQMPVWIALTSVLTFSVELYHSSFFVWKDLAAPDPYAVLPVCVVALQLLLQRLMPVAPGMDPAQARMMQYMPVILAFLYFNLPAGLMIYIFCNLVLTIVQQVIMKRLYHPPVLPA